MFRTTGATETTRTTGTVLGLLVFVSSACNLSAAPDQNPDLARWTRQAASISITRDDWGIAHVHGKTDADAVFGMIYAQAEDDFNRIETNYLNSMGRLAEAEGESAIWRDLRMKIFIDPADMKAQYAKAPDWLKKLMNAWADGLNFYLSTHPNVKPRVITTFEPWMALTFSEGSIGGDIERVNLRTLERFYASTPASGASPSERSGAEGPPRVSSSGGIGGDEVPPIENEPGGSNGFAIAPSNSASKKALLWINPHTSFFFRSELQMTSDEGLNAYGAVTWGQFFIYQGFNERAGWMHTSSGVDNIDEYNETVTKKGDGYVYRFGSEERPVTETKITIPYKTPGGMSQKTITVYRTHHGPIVRSDAGKWISVRMMQEPLKALTQSYSRTRSTNYKTFRATMELHTNSSNNTIFADAEGNIAYFHANFIPKRNPKFDWTRPVDGSDPATEWGPLMSVEESPFLLNPKNGWLYNTNNSPWSAAGANSPRKENFAGYVDANSENPRGIHAIRVLDGKTNFTIDSVRDAAFDSYLPEFARIVPELVKGYDELPAAHALKKKLAAPVDALRAWDFRWSAASVPTSVAVFWGDALPAGQASGSAAGLEALARAVDKLEADFGKWDTAWGEINRFQRISPEIVHPFDDKAPSIPVPFTSARWGSLASFGAAAKPGTKKWYGTSGNSFVAVVEFGDKVRAKAVTAGGESGDPKSPHFNDQAARYASGNLRDVYFYPDQLKGHTARTYAPGK
jgi:acyl-homoserine-lactone acylase